jgi:hypothetical protein
LPFRLPRGAPDVAVHDGLGNPAGRRPGFVYETTLARPAHHARDAYVKWLGVAWRQPTGDAASHASTNDAAPPAASLSKEDAYREYCQYLQCVETRAMNVTVLAASDLDERIVEAFGMTQNRLAS